MANFTEATQISPTRFVPVSSRYATSSVVYYTENKLLTFKIYKKTPATIGPQDKYYVVSAGHQYRPDLVSNLVYGTPDFWWRIMEANNIKDIFDFKAGLNLRIPEALLG